MASWYVHNIAAWMDGTEKLEHAAYRAYHIVCQLMYLNEGPIENNETGLAGRCNQHPLKFRHALAQLVKLGKIKIVDGKLSNDRVMEELKRLSTPRQPRANRKATPASPPSNPAATTPGSGSQAIENIHTEKQTRLDKTRQEETIKEDAASAAVLPFEAPAITKQKTSEEQAKTDYYTQFKTLMGPSGAAMATKLLKAKGGNVWQAMSALGAAREAGDIRSYIGGIISRAHDPAEGIHRGL